MNVSILNIFLGEECSKYRLFFLFHRDIRMKISQAARGILVHGSCKYACEVLERKYQEEKRRECYSSILHNSRNTSRGSSTLWLEFRLSYNLFLCRERLKIISTYRTKD